MSEEKLKQEAERWYRQAVDDLDAAEALRLAKKYAQACFYAQQSAEKGVKAVWIQLDLDPWGHSVARLVRELPDVVKPNFISLLDDALALDKLCIPTRYPDALPDLTPAEAYTQREAETAIQIAQTFLSAIQSWRST
ncbi:DNA-binding protein [filamentous cyanobacterium CCP2]|nr:DNA-binding protein [filamentous cyanobacterium CCP2]